MSPAGKPWVHLILPEAPSTLPLAGLSSGVCRGGGGGVQSLHLSVPDLLGPTQFPSGAEAHEKNCLLPGPQHPLGPRMNPTPS